MKKYMVFFCMLLAGIMAFSCIGKKKSVADAAPAEEPLPLCAAASIVIKPDIVSREDLAVASGREAGFTAHARDSSGRPIEAELDWYFRGLPEDADIRTAGQGHVLTKDSSTSATFRATGRTPGEFRIAAEIKGCADKAGMPVRGTAKVFVKTRSGVPAYCGPISVMYGSREVSGETVIGYVPMRLKAEAYGSKSFMKKASARFYINGKRIKPDRKFIKDGEAAAALDYEAAFWAYVPFWRPSGEYTVYYDLMDGEDIICSSENAYFTAH